MKSELNEKISCCCSLFRAETYKGLSLENISDMVLFANNFLLNVDIEKDMERESQLVGGFNHYYSIWHKSISPINISIGFLIRYNQSNEITKAIRRIEAEDKFKSDILNILGVIGIALASKLEIVEETLNRLRIAVGSSIEVNIYRDKISIGSILSNLEGKGCSSFNQPLQNEELKYDIDAITRIYNYCNGDTFSVSFKVFVDAIAKADFSIIYNANGTTTSKCAYLISIIKKFVYSKDWYRNAANSINTEPTRCSGMKVPPKWKNDLQKISRSITPY